MNRSITALCAAAAIGLALAAPARAGTHTVSFDDLPVTSDFANPMPAGYGGIAWEGNNWEYLVCGVVTICPTAGPDPYPYTPHTYPGMATVDFALGTTMQFGFTGGPAVFNGAWVTTFDNDIFGYVLKLGGVTVHTTPIMTSNAAPSFASSGYGGQVDEVDIVASDIGDWAIDDLSFTTAAVPEPTSNMLLLAGLMTLSLAGLAARRRR